MDPTFDVPPGFVLLKKGGRPDARARNFAVLLAKKYYEDTLGGVSGSGKAEEKLIELFGLWDESHARKIVRAALKKGRKGGVIHYPERCMVVWIPGHYSKKLGLLVPHEGGQMWLWAPGMTEAAEGRVVNVKHSFSMQGTMPFREGPVTWAVGRMASKKLVFLPAK